MKKMIIILCCLCLTACQTKPKESPINDSGQKPKETNRIEQTEQKADDLVMKYWSQTMNGDGNEAGYYHFREGEEGNQLISYMDYETGQEVYLCQKPECRHDNENCTALIPFGLSVGQIIVFQNQVYFIDAGGFSYLFGPEGNGVNQIGPKIYRMDLNGDNRKELFHLEEGYQFRMGNVVLDSQYLYVPVDKSEQVALSDQSNMQVTLDTYLYRIDLSNGKGEKIKDIQNENILAVDGRKIILEGHVYEDNPQKYLDEGNYDAYNEALMHSTQKYEIYDLDTGESEFVEMPQDVFEVYYDGSIYWMEGHKLMCMDLGTSEIKEFISLPETKNEYVISDVVAEHLILETFDLDREVNANMYKVSLKEASFAELHHFKREPKESVRILNQTSDAILAIYDREGQMEETWAGTMQYEIEKEYYGLISMTDYLDDKQDYRQIKTLEQE